MRKEREELGQQYEAKYFFEDTDPDTNEKMYKFGKRDYWEDRKSKNWSHLESLF